MTVEEIESDATSSSDSYQPYWADGPCPSWCDRDHPCCRQHMSTSWMCFVVLSTENPVVHKHGPGGTLDYVPKELQTYIEQDVREIGPRVVIEELLTGKPKLNLLPAEAIHLGEALIRLATMATDDTKLVKCKPCDMHPS
jgi:hypothetical protein